MVESLPSKQKTTGSLPASRSITDQRLIARFWPKVDVKGADECWPWLSVIDAHGYGRFRINNPRRMESAYRVAYLIVNGDIPDGLLVRHRCDNPPCCNPAHLLLGSYRDNIRDCIMRGRFVTVPQDGENNGNAKLTEDRVRVIKMLIGQGRNNTEIGKEFGLHNSTVSLIRLGKTWAHVDVVQ